jgi:hypothetical protein
MHSTGKNHYLYSPKHPMVQPGFDFQQRQDFSLLYSFKTGSEDHPAHLIGAEGFFTGGKAAGVKLILNYYFCVWPISRHYSINFLDRLLKLRGTI